MFVLELDHLSKRFRDSWGRSVQALTDVTLDVRSGEIFGILGPNGAGKSTTFKLVLGMARPSSGAGKILGDPLGSRRALGRVGFLPETPYFYDYLDPREFLETCGRLSGMSSADCRKAIPVILERVGLDPGETRKLGKFSKGMLQRIGLAQALIHDPDFVILDEPMSGLDPAGRLRFRDIILGLKKSGKTVVFASHILPDVEAICDRVAFLVGGSVRRVGAIGEMVAPGGEGFEIEATGLSPALVAAWSVGGALRTGGDRVIVQAADQHDLEEKVKQVFNSGGSLLGVRARHTSLEEIFLSETELVGGASLEGNQGAA